VHRRSAAKRAHNNFIVRRSSLQLFRVKYRERAHPLDFTQWRRVLQPAKQSACSKFGRGSDRMTHNASAAAAAGAAVDKRSEKGISTTMRGCAIILSFNSGVSSNVFVLVGL